MHFEVEGGLGRYLPFHLHVLRQLSSCLQRVLQQTEQWTGELVFVVLGGLAGPGLQQKMGG